MSWAAPVLANLLALRLRYVGVEGVVGVGPSLVDYGHARAPASPPLVVDDELVGHLKAPPCPRTLVAKI